MAEQTAKQVFLASVSARVAGDRNHGWGAEDSLAVIKALFGASKGTWTDEVGGLVKTVINPSQFRQALEDSDVLNRGVKTLKGINADLASLK